jgi:SAM-dependent methyltransferase
VAIETRSRERLKAHYEIERELADRLRTASPQTRKSLYGTVYDELFTAVPDHPQLTATPDRGQRRLKVQGQLSFVRKFLRPDTVFLELGAGDCALALEVADLVRTVYALDVSESITAPARRGGKIHVVLSDGVSVEVPAASVTLAYSNQLMEHLHPDDALVQLRNIVRALAPGGLYVCITPNRLTGPHDISMYFDRVATGFHLKEYTVTELADLMRAAGFTSVVAYLHGQGRTVRIPLSLVIAVEAVVDRLPDDWRARVFVRRPWRWLLSVRLVARR